VLICGNQEDPHTRAVFDEVVRRGFDPFLVDAESLARTSFASGASDFSLDGISVFQKGERGWIRRLAPDDWNAKGLPGSLGQVVSQAWTSAMVSIVERSGIEWLTDLTTLFRAEDKLLQLRLCNSIGINSPKTVLTNDPDAIPESFGQSLVIKPIGPSYFLEDGGEAKIVFATSMDRSDSRMTLLQGAPFLVQPRIDAAKHLRTVTVRDRSWVCELACEEVGLDWRATDAAHDSFIPSFHPDVERDAVRLAEAIGVGYSSQDWIVDENGRSHFLDLNPAGQWLFLPSEASSQISQAIADWLAYG